ncbi:MAG: hypothetical protein AAGF82_04290 [Pseudomonadota bacterium]
MQRKLRADPEPNAFRAEGAAWSGVIKKRDRFAHADFWIPDPHSALPHLSGMTVVEHHTLRAFREHREMPTLCAGRFAVAQPSLLRRFFQGNP